MGLDQQLRIQEPRTVEPSPSVQLVETPAPLEWPTASKSRARAATCSAILLAFRRRPAGRHRHAWLVDGRAVLPDRPVGLILMVRVPPRAFLREPPPLLKPRPGEFATE